jgi:excinuclease ABC subunit C
MKSQALIQFAKKSLPDAPGVYFFLKKSERSAKANKKANTPAEKTILYIGRATSLRDRVASYAAADLLESRGPLIVDMISKADTVEWRQTDSVLEAIILESNLIKRHQPKHNTQEKDDRSYNYVVITDEDFPRVMLKRGRELEIHHVFAEKIKTKSHVKIKKIFGPYPQGGLLRQALVVIRKIFPFRDERAVVPSSEAFYRSIGLSPDTSSPEAKKAYAKTIRNLVLFFEGKKKALIKSLEKEMHAHAKRRDFEHAGVAKITLYALGHIQDVSLIKKDFENHTYLERSGSNFDSSSVSGSSSDIFRIEAYDVAHLGGSENVGVMTVVDSDGSNYASNKNEYRKFKISRDINDDTGSLSEMLRRRFNHPEWRLPDLIVVDGGSGQIHAAEKIITEKAATKHIPIVSVVKDDRHKARDVMRGSHTKGQENRHIPAILLANAEAHRFAITFHRKRLSKRMLGRNSVRK